MSDEPKKFKFDSDAERDQVRAVWSDYLQKTRFDKRRLESSRATLAFAVAQGLDQDRAIAAYVMDYFIVQNSMDDATVALFAVLQETKAESRPIFFGASCIGYAVADLFLIDWDVLNEIGIRPSAEAIATNKEGNAANDFTW